MLLASNTVMDIARKGFKILRQALPPHVSTICLPDVIVRDHISQAFSLHVCMLQEIKVRTAWERG